MKTVLSRLLQARDGQALVEYALIIALVAIAVIAGLSLVGSNIANQFSNIAAHFG